MGCYSDRKRRMTNDFINLACRWSWMNKNKYLCLKYNIIWILIWITFYNTVYNVVSFTFFDSQKLFYAQKHTINTRLKGEESLACLHVKYAGLSIYKWRHQMRRITTDYVNRGRDSTFYRRKIKLYIPLVKNWLCWIIAFYYRLEMKYKSILHTPTKILNIMVDMIWRPRFLPCSSGLWLTVDKKIIHQVKILQQCYWVRSPRN